MTDDELQNKIMKALSPVIGEKNVFNNDNIMHLGMGDFSEWDSFGHLRIVMEIESSFDIKFNSEEIFNIKTVLDFMNAIKQKI